MIHSTGFDRGSLLLGGFLALSLGLGGCSPKPTGESSPTPTPAAVATPEAPAATPPPQAVAPTPDKPEALTAAALPAVRAQIERAYEDIGYLVTTRDVDGLLKFYQIPFIDEGKTQSKAQVRADLEDMVKFMDELETEAETNLRFAQTTKILGMKVKGPNKVAVKNRATLMARNQETGARWELVVECTDVWARSGKGWLICESGGYKEISSGIAAEASNVPPPAAADPRYQAERRYEAERQAILQRQEQEYQAQQQRREMMERQNQLMREQQRQMNAYRRQDR